MAMIPSSMSLRSFIVVICLCAPMQFAEAQPASLRVVSLAPNLTELMFELGLGSNLVGRSSACDYPPEAQRIPVVGGFGCPNWEALENLKPDWVLATDLEKPGLLCRLQEMGIRTLLLPCESWDQLMQAGLAVSEAFGQRSVGEKFVHTMTARREDVQTRVAHFYAGQPRPRVYVEVWGDPLMTAGGESFLNDLIQLAGGANIATGWRQSYARVSSEWVIGQNPDVILLAYMLPNTSASGNIGKRPGWAAMRAVHQNAICADIEPDLLLRR